jgi:hypothetical protein
MPEVTGGRIAGFDYQELTSSWHGTINRSDAELTREFKIDWTQLGAFVGALRGGWTLQAADTWHFQQADRLTGLYSNFYCDDVSFESFGKAWRGSEPAEGSFPEPSTTGDSAWKYAKVIATYRVPKNDFSGDPNTIMEESIGL